MSEHAHRQPAQSTVATVLDAIASWVEKYRYAAGLRAELAHCGAEQVARIARDLGMSSDEFVSLASKGQHAADQLARLLRALGVDANKLAFDDPATMRALQQICITCGHKTGVSVISPPATPRSAITTTVRTRCRLRNCSMRSEQ